MEWFHWSLLDKLPAFVSSDKILHSVSSASCPKDLDFGSRCGLCVLRKQTEFRLAQPWQIILKHPPNLSLPALLWKASGRRSDPRTEHVSVISSTWERKNDRLSLILADVFSTWCNHPLPQALITARARQSG